MFGADSLASGADALVFGANTLASGADTLVFEANTLASGADMLVFGANTIETAADARGTVSNRFILHLLQISHRAKTFPPHLHFNITPSIFNIKFEGAVGEYTGYKFWEVVEYLWLFIMLAGK